jgi:hypothetical protein
MSGLITDEIVDMFALVGPPDKIGALTQERFGDIVQRVSLDIPDARVLESLRSIS